MKRPVLLAPLLALLLSSGCSLLSPETRVREKLIAAGIEPPLAACLAHKLVRKLSGAELERLNAAAKASRSASGHFDAIELAGRLQAEGDPHIVAVLTSAGLSCAILG